MKNYNIRNLKDLQAKKLELKVDYTLKQTMLKADGKLYLKQFTIGALAKRFFTPQNFLKTDDKFNLSGTLLSYVLPFLMNKTIFRGSGFITKAIVGLASGKVGKSLDVEHLSAMFNTVKGWFGKSKPRKEKKFIDYGIPPDSETY
ncbi:hypothetical protein EZJ43_00420 [Pedobacter changchengzhani]|uniref:Uncharacterized protein n=1 Tax=Pedobacter changchengzhani TaxID=2529274 RepID=A0A4R5MQD7_9SPHI|nr:hypothetical protein [Pedobacter changchengzhani]TDG37595.1 hypothetical protein EZJ43_00420 [Pedobacter changchengzhani]